MLLCGAGTIAVHSWHVQFFVVESHTAGRPLYPPHMVQHPAAVLCCCHVVACPVKVLPGWGLQFPWHAKLMTHVLLIEHAQEFSLSEQQISVVGSKHVFR